MDINTNERHSSTIHFLYPFGYLTLNETLAIPDRVYYSDIYTSLYPLGDIMDDPLIEFIKERRRALGLTQKELADRAGVGLRFVRDIEQGKKSVQLDKVNQLLALFGSRMEPVAFRMDVTDEKS